jgi:hypothetical protein
MLHSCVHAAKADGGEGLIWSRTAGHRHTTCPLSYGGCGRKEAGKVGWVEGKR